MGRRHLPHRLNEDSGATSAVTSLSAGLPPTTGGPPAERTVEGQAEPDAKCSQEQRRVQCRPASFHPPPPSLLVIGRGGGGVGAGLGGWLPSHGVGCSSWFGRNRFCINGVLPPACLLRQTGKGGGGWGGGDSGCEMMAASNGFTRRAKHRGSYFDIQMIFLFFYFFSLVQRRRCNICWDAEGRSAALGSIDEHNQRSDAAPSGGLAPSASTLWLRSPNHHHGPFRVAGKTGAIAGERVITVSQSTFFFSEFGEIQIYFFLFLFFCCLPYVCQNLFFFVFVFFHLDTRWSFSWSAALTIGHL